MEALRLKIEADSDSDASFFGNSQLNTAAMDMDQLDDNFFSSDISDLDFTLLQDLPLPNEFNLLDDVCLPDDCNSNSNSFTSEIYLDPSSQSSLSSPFTDSPPLTPPSQTDSDGSVYSPSPSQVDVKLKAEPNNNLLLSPLGNHVIPIPLLKSSRGRSASHDSPDIQAMKRHIRMIRNRESACLSRKKKKDHVTNLETHVADLQRENAQLKQENALLRARLGIQQSSMTATTNSTSPKMYSNDATFAKSKSNIPKTSAVVKVALLGLCCFLFISFRPPTQHSAGSDSLIEHNLNHTSKTMRNSDLTPNSFSDLQLEPVVSDGNLHSNFLRSRRSFGLWETDNSVDHPEIDPSNKTAVYNATAQDNTRHNSTATKNVNLDVSPSAAKEFKRHFHNPRSYRNLTFTTPTPVNKCPTYFNQTEALRVQNDLKGIFGRRAEKKKVPTKPLVYSLIDLELQSVENKGLTVYNEKMLRFSSVLDQLQQREDTFYVVSLSFENQLLLSAKAHNTTSRPKMSFVMPWKNETHGGKEEIMQIDCEVTRVLNLNSRNSKRKGRK